VETIRSPASDRDALDTLAGALPSPSSAFLWIVVGAQAARSSSTTCFSFVESFGSKVGHPISFQAKIGTSEMILVDRLEIIGEVRFP